MTALLATDAPLYAGFAAVFTLAAIYGTVSAARRIGRRRKRPPFTGSRVPGPGTGHPADGDRP